MHSAAPRLSASMPKEPVPGASVRSGRPPPQWESLKSAGEPLVFNNHLTPQKHMPNAQLKCINIQPHSYTAKSSWTCSWLALQSRPAKRSSTRTERSSNKCIEVTLRSKASCYTCRMPRIQKKALRSTDHLCQNNM